MDMYTGVMHSLMYQATFKRGATQSNGRASGSKLSSQILRSDPTSTRRRGYKTFFMLNSAENKF